MFIHLPINKVKESKGCLLFTAFEIDSSTICRCIGLRNKNNQLILENDTAEIFGKNGLFIIQ